MLGFEDSVTPLRGDFHLEVLRGEKVVERCEDHNLIVDSGRHRMAQMAAGESADAISFIGVGESGKEEKGEDTSLLNQQLFPLTKRASDGTDARFDFLIGPEQANGMSIREFGLFCLDGTMFSHRVRRKKSDGTPSVIEKEEDISIQGYWIIHF